jgi:periplasmic protein CpxP/Spy
MKQVHKHLLIAGLLATFGLASVAQTPAAPPVAPPGGPMMGRMAQGDPAKMQAQRTERHAARMTALKAKLQITPAQEGAWTAFGAAMQPPARTLEQHAQFRAEMDKLTTPERIDKMQALKAQRDAEMAKRADATKTFYAALSPEQKKVFDTESLRMGRMGRNGGHHGGPGMGMGPGMGPGMGMGPVRN